ncbi:dTMP kinase [Candidatus Woesearchaeota archaeon]|nr:dTMP kinase [Candidatus Woesearchaeota archaeon]
MRGILISFEAGEGAGKGTQVSLLKEYLEKKGFKVLLTREPGGLPLPEALRKEVQHPDKEHTPEGELLLFSTARYLHAKDKIKPALEKGMIVITDRLHDSTTVYQGYAGGIDINFIKQVHKVALGDIMPDLTIFIDIDPELGLKKMTTNEFGKPDRMESKGLEFHKKVREGYLTLAKLEPDRIKVIKYRDGDIEGMQNEIRDYVDKLLEIKE